MYAPVSVVDEGRGVVQERLPHLFGKRAAASGAGDEEGATMRDGLGFAVPRASLHVVQAASTLPWLWMKVETVPSSLPVLTFLSLENIGITELSAGLFSGLSKLEGLNLSHNQLTSHPDGLFSGLTGLTTLSLGDNPDFDDVLPLTVTLETAEDGQVRAKVLAGAPSDLVLPVSVENGTLASGATGLRVAKGSVAGDPVSVIRTGDTGDVTVDLGTPLPSLPPRHSGYEYAKAASGLPVEVPDALEREPGVEGEFRLAPETVNDYADDVLDRVNGHVGRVEVFHAERWGTVSDDGLLRTGNEASALLCQAMGYAAGEFASGYGQPGVPSVKLTRTFSRLPSSASTAV